MTAQYILPLKAPIPLPATGEDVVTFKVWQNTLKSHIQQDANHHHFMAGGLYSEWVAADIGERISALHDDDHDMLVLDGKEMTDAEYNRGLAALLTSRN